MSSVYRDGLLSRVRFGELLPELVRDWPVVSGQGAQLSASGLVPIAPEPVLAGGPPYGSSESARHLSAVVYEAITVRAEGIAHLETPQPRASYHRRCCSKYYCWVASFHLRDWSPEICRLVQRASRQRPGGIGWWLGSVGKAGVCQPAVKKAFRAWQGERVTGQAIQVAAAKADSDNRESRPWFRDGERTRQGPSIGRPCGCPSLPGLCHGNRQADN